MLVAVWRWACGLTSLCFFPHALSPHLMLEPSLRQGVVGLDGMKCVRCSGVLEYGHDGCTWMSLQG